MISDWPIMVGCLSNGNILLSRIEVSKYFQDGDDALARDVTAENHFNSLQALVRAVRNARAGKLSSGIF